jgi:hypothetical protein
MYELVRESLQPPTILLVPLTLEFFSMDKTRLRFSGGQPVYCRFFWRTKVFLMYRKMDKKKSDERIIWRTKLLVLVFYRLTYTDSFFDLRFFWRTKLWAGFFTYHGFVTITTSSRIISKDFGKFRKVQVCSFISKYLDCRVMIILCTLILVDLEKFKFALL